MSAPLNVLVLLPVSEEQAARLVAAAPDAAFTWAAADADASWAAPGAATPEQVAEAEVVIGNLPPARLTECRRLRMLQLNSAGFDTYLAAGTLPAGAALCSASGAYGQAVSEHLFAMVLSLMKRLPSYQDHQRAHEWADEGPVATLAGARVLVLGAGDIGSHFAQLAAAMGAHVTGVRRRAGGARPPFEDVCGLDELPGLLGSADVVASFLPSTPATRGLADEAFFRAMRPGAYFANGGRGDLVVTDALVAALCAGRLAGAALDVTDPEPLPADHPLWDAPGALITPHVSGGFHLSVTLDNIVDIAAENLRRLAAGKPLRNQVDVGAA